jgi:hypothetical protein
MPQATPPGWAPQPAPPYRQDQQPAFQPTPQGQPWQQQDYGPQPQVRYADFPQYPPPPRRRHTARKVIGGLAGLALVVIGISVAANSGHSVKTSGAVTGGSGSGAAAKTAGIGSAITLTGNSPGEQVAVTVTKTIATATPADEFSGASAGKRLYAVQFRLKNTGSAAYSDAPSNGAAVTDSAGQSYDAQVAGNAAGCPSFAAPENIAAGASGLGCIVFEIPEAAKITRVQFTLNSGMGPDTGQWTVG